MVTSADLRDVPSYLLLEELARRNSGATEEVETQIRHLLAYVEGWLWSQGFENASEYLRKEANIVEVIDHILDDDCSPIPFSLAD